MRNSTASRQNKLALNTAFAEHFRCPEKLVAISSASARFGEAGYFRFGEDVVCFGSSSSRVPAANLRGEIPDVKTAVVAGSNEVQLPFELNQVARNLRCEYYAGLVKEQDTQLPPNPLVRNLYYLARPLMSVGFRKVLQ